MLRVVRLGEKSHRPVRGPVGETQLMRMPGVGGNGAIVEKKARKVETVGSRWKVNCVRAMMARSC